MPFQIGPNSAPGTAWAFLCAFPFPNRLSFHATGDLLDRGYAGLGYASVSRFTTSVAVFCAIESILQVILVNVKKILVKKKLLVTHLEVVVMEAGRDSTVEPRAAV